VDGVLPNARGTVESVLRSYQVGRAEFLTLLSVEDARYRTELEAVAVAADYQAQLVMLRQLTAGETQPWNRSLPGCSSEHERGSVGGWSASTRTTWASASSRATRCWRSILPIW